MNSENLALGNEKLMEQVNAEINAELHEQVRAEQKQGKTVPYLSVGQAAVWLCGYFG